MAAPRKIETPAQMKRAIERYFKSCEGKPLKDEYGRPMIYKGYPVMIGAHAPTTMGLARAVGLKSRQSLLNYQGREEFRDLVEDAKARLMEYAEERLYDRDGARGAEFNLRYNFGWGSEETTKDKETGGVVLLPPVSTEEDGRAESSRPTENAGGEDQHEERGSDQGVGEGDRETGQEDPGSEPGAGGAAEGSGGAPEGEQ